MDISQGNTGRFQRNYAQACTSVHTFSKEHKAMQQIILNSSPQFPYSPRGFILYYIIPLNYMILYYIIVYIVTPRGFQQTRREFCWASHRSSV